jgi:ribosome recycling factor
MCLQKEKMEKAIETVQTNFNTVRTGRASPAMLDRIEVWWLVLVLFALMM